LKKNGPALAPVHAHNTFFLSISESGFLLIDATGGDALDQNGCRGESLLSNVIASSFENPVFSDC